VLRRRSPGIDATSSPLPIPPRLLREHHARGAGEHGTTRRLLRVVCHGISGVAAGMSFEGEFTHVFAMVHGPSTGTAAETFPEWEGWDALGRIGIVRRVRDWHRGIMGTSTRSGDLGFGECIVGLARYAGGGDGVFGVSVLLWEVLLLLF